ncbi:MAG TPA: glycosyltransferase [Bordetella sp.]|nr:glycosyltransferase [Bordetella sp.]
MNSALPSSYIPQRIALLGAANSIHTVRWANGLAQLGVEVHLLSLHQPGSELLPAVRLHRLPFAAPLGYVLAAPAVRRILDDVQPELLNAHYATGYGLLARLAKFHPLLLSAWGTDIYKFPCKTALHRRLLADNLQFATLVASTSHAMAERITSIEPVPVVITPFGIDHTKFCPRRAAYSSGQSIVVGTIKGLEPQYGIDTLLRAFQIVVLQLGRSHPQLVDQIVLRIYGKGGEKRRLQALARTLGIEQRVTFAGFIRHDDVPVALGEMDIYVALSRQDSFGVAILEASACGVPVVVSDADGPAEVVADGVSGFVVPTEDAGFAAARIMDLILDAGLRARMGAHGRQHVIEHYSWDHSLQLMLEAYRQTLRLEQSCRLVSHAS